MLQRKMNFTKVRVLHSRSSLGVPGDIIKVTPERLALLLEQRLVEKIEDKPSEKTKGRSMSNDNDNRTDQK